VTAQCCESRHTPAYPRASLGRAQVMLQTFRRFLTCPAHGSASAGHFSHSAVLILQPGETPRLQGRLRHCGQCSSLQRGGVIIRTSGHAITFPSFVRAMFPLWSVYRGRKNLFAELSVHRLPVVGEVVKFAEPIHAVRTRAWRELCHDEADKGLSERASCGRLHGHLKRGAELPVRSADCADESQANEYSPLHTCAQIRYSNEGMH